MMYLYVYIYIYIHIYTGIHIHFILNLYTVYYLHMIEHQKMDLFIPFLQPLPPPGPRSQAAHGAS